MPRSDTFPLVDRIVPGGLVAFFAEHEDDSNEDLAYVLRTEHDITVSAETIRRWRNRVSDEPTEASA